MSDILGSVGGVLRASLNDAVDHAEDPQAMLSQLLRSYARVIEDVRQAQIQALGRLQLANDDLSAAQAESAGWGIKAQTAAERAAALQAAGNATDAARFDDLTRRALRQQLSDEDLAGRFHQLVAEQAWLADRLKEALTGMRAKLLELQSKRDELAARARMADAQQQIQATLDKIEAMRPRSDDMDAGRDALPEGDTDAEIDARLASLKGSNSVLVASGV